MLSAPIFDRWERISVQTPYGEVLLQRTAGYVYLQRHGAQKIPPHNINHLANVWALRNLKVRKVVAINSVGSLQPEMKPGAFVIPDDFFSPCMVPTFFQEEMRFMVPHMDEALAKKLYTFCRNLNMNVTLGGVYVQTFGPRLETKAEINFFRRFGNVVGMTMASEATLCMEQCIPYVSICSVDNYGNGITRKPLTVQEVVRNAKRSRHALERLVRALVEENGP
jgi:purine nucleoside phosphorylase